MSSDSDADAQLFIMRLWRVRSSDGLVEWRGRLQHAQTNEIRYFRDWPALIPSLLAMLREVGPPPESLAGGSPQRRWPETPAKDPGSG